MQTLRLRYPSSTSLALVLGRIVQRNPFSDKFAAYCHCRHHRRNVLLFFRVFDLEAHGSLRFEERARSTPRTPISPLVPEVSQQSRITLSGGVLPGIATLPCSGLSPLPAAV